MRVLSDRDIRHTLPSKALIKHEFTVKATWFNITGQLRLTYQITPTNCVLQKATLLHQGGD